MVTRYRSWLHANTRSRFTKEKLTNYKERLPASKAAFFSWAPFNINWRSFVGFIIAIGVACFLITVSFFRIYQLPPSLDGGQALARKASAEIQKSGFDPKSFS